MRRYLQAFLLLSALFVGSNARADDVAMAEARSRFQEGLNLADESKYEEARIKFLQAAAVLKSAAVLFNLASTEQKTGHDVEAIEHYRGFLKAGVNDTRITDAMREKAKTNIAELLKKVAQVDIDAPDGTRVTVDGKPLEEQPKELIAVAPGKHTIEGTFSGKVKSVAIEGAVGQTVKAKLDFDGAAVGEQPPPVTTEGNWPTPKIVTVAGLGAGAIVGGILFFVFRGSAQSSVDESKSLLNGGSCIGITNAQCTRASELKDDRDTNVTLSTVSMVGGVAFAAGAVAAAVLWPKRTERVGVLAPSVSTNYAGFSFARKF